MIIRKADDALQVVFGEVLVPNTLDGQQQIIPPEVVVAAAHNFLKNGCQRNIDIQHNGEKVEGACVVQNMIAREGDPDFHVGAWVVGIYLPSEAYQLYLDGELDGFSPYGKGTVEVAEIEVMIPTEITGTTMPGGEDDHTHAYTVTLDKNGKPVSGITSPAGDDMHIHAIVKHTSTETSGTPEHKHKFDILVELYPTTE